MKANLNSPLRILLSQLFIFIISLLDDLLLVLLSRWGLHVPWLQWLAPVIFGCTVLHLIWQLLHQFRTQKALLADSATP